MGPLEGYTIVEFVGLGPGPFCAMMLADMGARVIRIDRASGSAKPIDIDPRLDVAARGRRSIAVDLKRPEGVRIALRIISAADGLIEGHRPGVMERLGLGPRECLKLNPRLVYGRMTGFGQNGPMAQAAGHDINYLALSSCLHFFGRSEERPAPPLNLVADMGGGGLLLAFGMTCALLERQRSGKGQVIDAAMFEGAALLATSIYAQRATGWWRDERGTNLLDTGAHFYEVYETRDRGYLAVGALEPQFYAALLAGMGLDASSLPEQMNRAEWPRMKRLFADVFRTRTRDEWTDVFKDTDACVTPVLSPAEAMQHEHCRARGSFRSTAGVVHPAPAPRFDRSVPAPAREPPVPGRDSEELLREFGFSAAEIGELRASGALGKSGA